MGEGVKRNVTASKLRPVKKNIWPKYWPNVVFFNKSNRFDSTLRLEKVVYGNPSSLEISTNLL